MIMTAIHVSLRYSLICTTPVDTCLPFLGYFCFLCKRIPSSVTWTLTVSPYMFESILPLSCEASPVLAFEMCIGNSGPIQQTVWT